MSCNHQSAGRGEQVCTTRACAFEESQLHSPVHERVELLAIRVGLAGVAPRVAEHEHAALRLHQHLLGLLRWDEGLVGQVLPTQHHGVATCGVVDQLVCRLLGQQPAAAEEQEGAVGEELLDGFVLPPPTRSDRFAVRHDNLISVLIDVVILPFLVVGQLVIPVVIVNP